MTAVVLVLASGFLVMGWIANEFRLERDEAEGKCCKALDRAAEHEADSDYYRSLLGYLGKPVTNANRIDVPDDLVIGTRAYPLELVRVTDQSLNDRAHFSTLSDLMRNP